MRAFSVASLALTGGAGRAGGKLIASRISSRSASRCSSSKACTASFPEGTITTTTNSSNAKVYGTWPILILPYVEHEALHDQYDFNELNQDVANAEVVRTNIPVYNCPSDLVAGTIDVPDSGPGKGAKRQYCHSSYRGNSGTIANGEESVIP
jgi:hypothetical protein